MISPESHPALVLNADFRPLSYLPLSLWHWQDAIKASFQGRVNVVSEYEHSVRSPSRELRLPSVIALKDYVPMRRQPTLSRLQNPQAWQQQCPQRWLSSQHARTGLQHTLII